ncbi:hypothetical protein [Chryseobacterium sp. ERMR1:04]|uniref:hypothetical protein n=1 Tax=Chryseobacterium sp. ERMR1:04 TaxID=1705393 RepID=UPI0006C84CC1|nr:hypothetical protein [Chryseobacterium sp. ERMR1:04]KPH14717.1 hypothetical protein AMQ68_04510 [Chryseobacterium sp. ERMR1:04]
MLFNLTLKSNPYKEEFNSEYEIWGEVVLVLSDQSKTVEILNHQWDILVVYEWFQKNKAILLTESFPFYFENERCIANCRDILYEKNDFKDLNEEIEYYDTIENYFSNHYFKLKGTDNPILCIGLKIIMEKYRGLTFKRKNITFILLTWIISLNLLKLHLQNYLTNGIRLMEVKTLKS